MKGKIQISKPVTTEDFRTAVHFNAYSKNFVLPAVMLAGLAYAIYGAVISFTRSNGEIGFGIFSSILVVAVIVLIIYNTEQIVKRFAKRNQDVLGEERQIIFTEELISAEGREKGDFQEYGWYSAKCCYEIKKMFLFYTNTKRTIIIPKAYMTEEQILQLREMLERKLKKNFHRRSK